MHNLVVTWPEEVQTSWLAGAVDTDGTMGFAFTNTSVSPYVSVTNTSSQLLGAAKALYPGRLCNDMVSFDFHLSLTQQILERIYPFLIVKRARAGLLLEFLASRERRKYCSYTRNELSIIRQYYSIMEAMYPDKPRQALERFLKREEGAKKRRISARDRLEQLEVGKVYTVKEIVNITGGPSRANADSFLSRLHHRGLVEKIRSGRDKPVRWVRKEGTIFPAFELPRSKDISNMAREVQSAWLAALIDCDGSIGFSFQKDSVSPFVKMGNICMDLLEAAHQIYPGSIRPFCSGTYTLRFYRRDISRLLERILPYLIVKQKNANLLLSYIALRKDRKYKPYSWAEMRVFKEYIRHMERIHPNRKHIQFERFMKKQEDMRR